MDLGDVLQSEIDRVFPFYQVEPTGNEQKQVLEVVYKSLRREQTTLFSWNVAHVLSRILHFLDGQYKGQICRLDWNYQKWNVLFRYYLAQGIPVLDGSRKWATKDDMESLRSRVVEIQKPMFYTKQPVRILLKDILSRRELSHYTNLLWLDYQHLYWFRRNWDPVCHQEIDETFVIGTWDTREERAWPRTIKGHAVVLVFQIEDSTVVEVSSSGTSFAEEISRGIDLFESPHTRDSCYLKVTQRKLVGFLPCEARFTFLGFFDILSDLFPMALSCLIVSYGGFLPHD